MNFDASTEPTITKKEFDDWKKQFPQQKLGTPITALLFAAEKGNLSIVKYLIDNGASVNDVSRYSGFTALHCASLNGRIEIVKYLIDNGASVNDVSRDSGCTALHYAI